MDELVYLLFLFLSLSVDVLYASICLTKLVEQGQAQTRALLSRGSNKRGAMLTHPVKVAEYHEIPSAHRQTRTQIGKFTTHTYTFRRAHSLFHYAMLSTTELMKALRLRAQQTPTQLLHHSGVSPYAPCL